MAVWDIFSSNAYSMQSLTEAVNLMPYKPRMLGDLSNQFSVFATRPVPTTEFLVEYKRHKLSLIPNTPRNGPRFTPPAEKRDTVAVSCLHHPYEDAIYPDDVQDKRQFGVENALQTVQSATTEKLQNMRDDFEVDHEYQRANAVQGKVLDDDGTEIINFFDAFGITETSVSFGLAAATSADLQTACATVYRTTEDILGEEPMEGIVGLCSDSFYDALVTNSAVEVAYDRWNNGQFLRDDLRYFGFQYRGITFINYRGKIGARNFIADDTCRFFPVGVRGLFQGVFAPANVIDQANLPAQMMYADQELKPKKMGVDIFGETNPLFHCTQPGVCIEGTLA